MVAALFALLAVACNGRHATTTLTPIATPRVPTIHVPVESTPARSTRTPMPPAPRALGLTGPTVVVESSSSVVTGENVDPLIHALESQDVDGLLNALGTYFEVRGCSGDEWPLREVLDADHEALRGTFEKAFARGVGSSIYAIAVGPVSRGGGNDFQVWVSASRDPSPTAPATFWVADEAGRLTALDFLCGRLGAGERTGAGTTGYLVAPRAYCIEGAAETFLEVEETGVDQPAGGIIVGQELLGDGSPTGGRVEVTFPFVDLGTNLVYQTPPPGATPAPPLYLGAASRLHIEGLRLRSCVVQASKIATMQ